MNKIIVAEGRHRLIKSCAQEVLPKGAQYTIDKEGPVNQERWMVIGAMDHIFRSQRNPGSFMAGDEVEVLQWREKGWNREYTS